LGKLGQVRVYSREEIDSRPDIICLTPRINDENVLRLPIKKEIDPASGEYSKEESYESQDTTIMFSTRLPTDEDFLDCFFDLLSFSNSGDEVDDYHYDRGLMDYDVKPEIMSKFRKLLERFFAAKSDDKNLNFEITDYVLYDDHLLSENLFGYSFLKEFKSIGSRFYRYRMRPSSNFVVNFVREIKSWFLSDYNKAKKSSTDTLEFYDYLICKIGFTTPEGEADCTDLDEEFIDLLKRFILDKKCITRPDYSRIKRLNHFVADLLVIVLFDEFLNTSDDIKKERLIDDFGEYIFEILKSELVKPEIGEETESESGEETESESGEETESESETESENGKRKRDDDDDVTDNKKKLSVQFF